MACSDTANTEKCDGPAKGTGALHTGLQRPLGGQVMTAAAAILSLIPGRWAQLSTGGPACTAGTLLQGCAASCASSATAAPQEESLINCRSCNHETMASFGDCLLEIDFGKLLMQDISRGRLYILCIGCIVTVLSICRIRCRLDE